MAALRPPARLQPPLPRRARRAAHRAPATSPPALSPDPAESPDPRRLRPHAPRARPFAGAQDVIDACVALAGTMQAALACPHA